MFEFSLRRPMTGRQKASFLVLAAFSLAVMLGIVFYPPLTDAVLPDATREHLRQGSASFTEAFSTWDRAMQEARRNAR